MEKNKNKNLPRSIYGVLPKSVRIPRNAYVRAAQTIAEILYCYIIIVLCFRNTRPRSGAREGCRSSKSRCRSRKNNIGGHSVWFVRLRTDTENRTHRIKNGRNKAPYLPAHPYHVCVPPRTAFRNRKSPGRKSKLQVYKFNRTVTLVFKFKFDIRFLIPPTPLLHRNVD